MLRQFISYDGQEVFKEHPNLIPEAEAY